ncbi:hypothetical protein HPB51_006092 [Rhipicephalus microplus]|uniref:Uncharacterized protein n=1 Tax=Rhipicephalus microplus TaxID=6941 RepID=A0A9J6ERL6_RHIMP|nr:hypothetical protein HPB51_006092 [Rhipicephalus microplus]
MKCRNVSCAKYIVTISGGVALFDCRRRDRFERQFDLQTVGNSTEAAADIPVMGNSQGPRLNYGDPGCRGVALFDCRRRDRFERQFDLQTVGNSTEAAADIPVMGNSQGPRLNYGDPGCKTYLVVARPNVKDPFLRLMEVDVTHRYLQYRAYHYQYLRRSDAYVIDSFRLCGHLSCRIFI